MPNRNPSLSSCHSSHDWKSITLMATPKPHTGCQRKGICPAASEAYSNAHALTGDDLESVAKVLGALEEVTVALWREAPADASYTALLPFDYAVDALVRRLPADTEAAEIRVMLALTSLLDAGVAELDNQIIRLPAWIAPPAVRTHLRRTMTTAKCCRSLGKGQ